MPELDAPTPPKYSDWQIKRLRTRLLAVKITMEEEYPEKKKRNDALRKEQKRDKEDEINPEETTVKLTSTPRASWMTLTIKINRCKPAFHWLDHVEDEVEYDIPRKERKDDGYPLKDNQVHHFVVGEKPRGKGNVIVWDYDIPSNFILAAFEEYLRDTGFLSNQSFADHSGQLPEAEKMLKHLYPEGDLPLLAENDPLNVDLYNEQDNKREVVQRLLTTHTDRERQYYRAREHRNFYYPSGNTRTVTLQTKIDRGEPDSYQEYTGFGTLTPRSSIYFCLWSEDVNEESKMIYRKVSANAGPSIKNERVHFLEYNATALFTDVLSESGLISADIEPLNDLYFSITYEKHLSRNPEYGKMSDERKKKPSGNRRFMYKRTEKDTTPEQPPKSGAETKETMSEEELGEKLLDAARRGDLDQVLELEAKGVNVSYVNPKFNATVLHHAASCSAKRVIVLLYEDYKDEDLPILVKDHKDRFPSALAMEIANRPDIAEFLMEKEIEAAKRFGLDYRVLLEDGKASHFYSEADQEPGSDNKPSGVEEPN